MKTLITTVAALLISFSFFTMGNALLITLVGIRGQIQGISTTSLGLIMSAYYFGLLIGAFRVGNIVKRVGYIRAFSALIALLTISALAYLLWTHPITWFGLRLLSGVCVGGLFVITEAWLNASVSNQLRGSLLAIYALTAHLSAALGQGLLYFIDTSSYEIFIYIAIFCCIAMIPLLMTRSSAPAVPEDYGHINFRQLYITSPLAFLGVFVAGISSASFYSLSSVFILQSGLGENMIPIFINSAIFGAIILQLPIGKLSDHVDRRLMIIMISIIAGFSSLLLYSSAIIALPMIILFIATFIFGGTCLVIYSIAAAHANDFADTTSRTTLAGALIMVFGIGATIGPILGTRAMSLLQPAALFLFLGINFFGLAGFALYRMGIRQSVDKDQFTPVTPSSIGTLPQEILTHHELDDATASTTNQA